jgi:hypothetical protein
MAQASELGQTAFTPSIELLKILIAGKTEDINKYQFLLDELIKNYPETESAAYAEKLLETSRSYTLKQEQLNEGFNISAHWKSLTIS